jgi:hypothetical protein
MEEWKTLENYPNYAVSTHGRVKSLKRGRILKPSTKEKGYQQVVLYITGDLKYTRTIHRLVAESFIPNPENKPQVNHKDKNTSNNYVKNLEWATEGENQSHSHGKEYLLTSADGKTFSCTNLTDFCRQHKLRQPNLHKVLTGKRKSAQGWKITLIKE